MSALDFVWNASQSAQIDELTERIEKLEYDMETARMWVEYMNKRIDELNVLAGAEQMAGDGGYQLGNMEDYLKFVAKRNESMVIGKPSEPLVEVEKIERKE